MGSEMCIRDSEKARGVTTPSSPCVWEANIRRGSPPAVACRSWSDDPRQPTPGAGTVINVERKYPQRHLTPSDRNDRSGLDEVDKPDQEVRSIGCHRDGSWRGLSKGEDRVEEEGKCRKAPKRSPLLCAETQRLTQEEERCKINERGRINYNAVAPSGGRDRRTNRRGNLSCERSTQGLR